MSKLHPFPEKGNPPPKTESMTFFMMHADTTLQVSELRQQLELAY